MAEIDRLDIAIKADAQKASDSLVKLSASVTALSRAVGSFDVGKVDTMVASIRGITSAVGNLSRVDISGVKTTSNALKEIGSSIKTGKELTGANKNISRLASSLIKIGGKDSTISGSLSSMTKSIPELEKAMSGFNDDNMSKKIDNVARLTQSITRLGGKNGSNAIGNLPQLAGPLEELVKKINGMPAVREDVLRTIEALGKMPSKIGDFSKATQEKGGRASKALSKVGTVLGTIGTSLQKLKPLGIGFMSIFIHKSALSNLKSMVSKINQMFFGIRRVVIMAKDFAGYGKKLIKESMDFIETYNYFTQAMKQVAGNNNQKLVEDANKVFSDLTNFKADEKGFLKRDLTARGLGLDANQVLNYQTQFMQLSKSIGTTSEQAVKLSEGLTKIGADLASVKNMDFETVWQNLSSALVGMSRSVDKYGINIRANALDQKLLELGIDATSKSLNQAEKALLRTIIIIDSSEYAWSDLANTISTPANQFRLLQGNLSAVARGFGNILLPSVAKVLPYLNAITVALQKVIETITVFLGFEDFDWGIVSGKGLDNEGFSDYLDEQAESAENATEAVKKYENQILGFDEINKLSENKDNGKGNNDTPNISSVGSLLDDAFTKALDRYTIAWEEAFNKVGNGSNNLARRLSEEIQVIIDRIVDKDWVGVGSRIARDVNEGFRRAVLATNNMPEAVQEVFNGIAEIGNSFFDNLRTDLVGHFASNIINSLGEVIYSAFVTFDFTNLGSKIGEILNVLFEDINFEKIGEGLGGYFMKLPNTIVGIVKELNFDEVGRQLGTLISGIDVQLDFVKVFDGFADLVNGVDTALRRAFEKISLMDFVDELISGIAVAIGKINFSDLFVNASELFNTLNGAIISIFEHIDVREAFNSFTIGINDFLNSADFVDVGRAGGEIAIAINNMLSTVLETIDYKRLGEIGGEIIKGMPWVELVTTATELFLEVFASLPLETLGTMPVGTMLGLFGLTDPNARVTEERSAFAIKQEELDGLQDLVDRYFDLAENENKSKVQLEEFNAIRDTLESALPGFSQEIKKHSGSYRDQKKAVEDLIKKQQEYYMTLAGKEELEKLWGKMYKLRDEESRLREENGKLLATTEAVTVSVERSDGTLIKKTISLAEAVDEEALYNSLLEEGIYTEEEMMSMIGQAVVKLDDQIDKYNSNSKALEENKQKQQELSVEIGRANSIIDEYSNKRFGILGVRDALNEIGISQTTINNVKTQLQAIQRLFEEAGGKLKIAGTDAGSAYAKALIAGTKDNLRNQQITMELKSYTNGNAPVSVTKTTIKTAVYATGGFPEDGLFFANHSELVGKFSNGKTAVANNQQITEGIKLAVVEGMMQAFGGSGMGGSPTVENTFMVDSETLYKMVQRGQQSYDGRYHTVSVIS